MLKRKSLLVGALSTALLVLPLTNVSAKTPTVQQLQAQIVSLQNQVNQQKKIINQDNSTISNLQNQLKGSIVTKGNFPEVQDNLLGKPYPIITTIWNYGVPNNIVVKLTMNDFNQIQPGQQFPSNPDTISRNGWSLIRLRDSEGSDHDVYTYKKVDKSGNWIEVYVDNSNNNVIGVSKSLGVN